MCAYTSSSFGCSCSCEALVSLDTWARWCFYTEPAGEPDNVVALSPEWMLCRNAHRPVHPQQGKHITSTCYLPKWAVWTTDPKVIVSIPTLELSCLEGFYWCPQLLYHNSAGRLLLVAFQPKRLHEGWAQGIPGQAPAMVLSSMPATHSAPIHLAVRCYQIFCIGMIWRGLSGG